MQPFSLHLGGIGMNNNRGSGISNHGNGNGGQNSSSINDLLPGVGHGPSSMAGGSGVSGEDTYYKLGGGYGDPNLTSSASSSSCSSYLHMAPPVGSLLSIPNKDGSNQPLLLGGRTQLTGSSGLMYSPAMGNNSSNNHNLGHMSVGPSERAFQRPPHLGLSLKRSRSVSDLERVVELERLAEDDEAAGDLFLDFVSKVACRRPSIVDAPTDTNTVGSAAAAAAAAAVKLQQQSPVKPQQQSPAAAVKI
jgi:hypothetical protein